MPDVAQGALDLAVLQPGTRVLVRYKPIGHAEIDCKMQQVIYERIILWRVEGTCFVATPDFELCIEQGEWWSELWFLQGGSYSHCVGYLGRFVVHNFYKAFNVCEFTELVSVGRAKAQ